MIQYIKRIIKATLAKVGYQIVPARWDKVPQDKSLGMDSEFFPLYSLAEPHTMTSIEKMHALYRAVNYLLDNDIEGDFVECGVAAGGSMMMVALTLLSRGDHQRRLWLYDTYAGMPEPTDLDVNYRGDQAIEQWRTSQSVDHNEWCYFDLMQVKENIAKTGYPLENVNFIKGRVQDTIPQKVPGKIALLRLDTDWYESTRHELEQLYPRLESGGVLIVDDYGHWQGCRKATDEYFSDRVRKPLLNRIDRLGVISIKP